jgi:hypothetical protein
LTNEARKRLETLTPRGSAEVTKSRQSQRGAKRARTSEGRKRARAYGVLFGRPRKLTPHQRRKAIARRDTVMKR